MLLGPLVVVAVWGLAVLNGVNTWGANTVRVLRRHGHKGNCLVVALALAEGSHKVENLVELGCGE